MFRIRQLTDASSQNALREIEVVQKTLRERLPGLSAGEIDSLPDKLRDPLAYRFRAILFVAEDLKGRHRGFALLSHAPDIGFCLLDYIATAAGLSGHGVGGALYERVRETARELAPHGLFFECLPDEPNAVSDPKWLTSNRARLRFYEGYGARPIVGTEYELPLSEGQLDMPHLVWDDLDRGKPLDRKSARKTVRAILERKYSELCPPEYVQRVVESFRDDPIRLRAPRHHKQPTQTPFPTRPEVVLVVNAEHAIHHVRERGYVEAPVRVDAILRGLRVSGMFREIAARSFPDAHVLAVHDPGLVRYLRRTCEKFAGKKAVYPYVFPVRNATRPPKDLAYAAGYWCIDTFTPLDGNAWRAARRAVDCALTAADSLLRGSRLAYALVRPPGHHAERRVFGGFCYLNNNAIAAEYLSTRGRVAILDVDYHHGNGQQDIFWERDDVLTVSIHGHPRFAYPFFSGFPDERGAGRGSGFNLNLPLAEKVDGVRYRKELQRALRAIVSFKPRFLVVALGLDTAAKDPTGTWSLSPSDFEQNGRLIAALRLPTLVTQEGGYRTATLGQNARAFFEGLVAGATGGTA